MNTGPYRLLTLLLFFHLLHFSSSINTITSTNSIKDGEVLVSNSKVFALGFFRPGNSIKRYLGIRYNQIPEQNIVWVANRDNPIDDNSGVLSVSSDGNLVLYHKNQSLPLWSTNIKATKWNTSAQLLDSGNLVLVQNDTNTNQTILWQSFDYPTHTLLSFMKLGLDRKTGLNRVLTSWKSSDDPGIGNYSFRFDPTGFPQLSLYKDSVKWWRTGSWTGQRWTGVPEMTPNYIFKVSYVDNQDEVSITYSVNNPSIISIMMLNESGFMQRLTWRNRWIGFWSAPKEQCDYYGHCGANSNCNPYRSGEFECTCLPGYEPSDSKEWYLRDGSGGCKIKRMNFTCQNGEGFVKVAHVKVPDTSVTRVDMSLGLKECGNECRRNCTCIAYTSASYESKGDVGCLMYYGDMMDTRTYTSDGQDLYVRVDAIELAQYTKKGSISKKEIVGIVVVSCFVMLLMVAFVFWLLIRRKRKEKARINKYPYSYAANTSTILDDDQDLDPSQKNSDLPLFDFKTIAEATNNFSINNKLGEGGFGSVYKGVLQNGMQIAVKRLSKYSGQGIDEFKNEITLIAKLQHRNLVRTLGCCVEAQEKMILYEYLPNNSLDSFIFDEVKRSLLDWNKRFEIICGIARGILYLHQDSRLRIIHRDLKASNILLDAAMNPKISDFGMARIFGTDQNEANTNRVVGTYGYMSPEYAMRGLFSEKSDVYSFGVLLLEIIVGRKNNSFHAQDDASINLVGHIWDLWKEGKTMEIVDKSLGDDSYSGKDVLRWIQIGLLCVQEHVTDRPTMSTVVFMLGNDNSLPSPKQPAFITKRSHIGEDTTTSEGVCSSINEVTITMLQAR